MSFEKKTKISGTESKTIKAAEAKTVKDAPSLIRHYSCDDELLNHEQYSAMLDEVGKLSTLYFGTHKLRIQSDIDAHFGLDDDDDKSDNNDFVDEYSLTQFHSNPRVPKRIIPIARWIDNCDRLQTIFDLIEKIRQDYSPAKYARLQSTSIVDAFTAEEMKNATRLFNEVMTTCWILLPHQKDEDDRDDDYVGQEGVDHFTRYQSLCDFDEKYKCTLNDTKRATIVVNHLHSVKPSPYNNESKQLPITADSFSSLLKNPWHLSKCSIRLSSSQLHLNNPADKDFVAMNQCGVWVQDVTKQIVK